MRYAYAVARITASLALVTLVAATSAVARNSAAQYVGSLTALRPLTHVPHAVESVEVALAPRVGVSSTRAVRETRLLRADRAVRVYAFAGKGGRFCMIVEGRAGLCGLLRSADSHLAIATRDPLKSPPSQVDVVGVIGDAIQRVVVSLSTVDSRHPQRLTVGVRNNAFIARFVADPSNEVRVSVQPLRTR